MGHVAVTRHPTRSPQADQTIRSNTRSSSYPVGQWSSARHCRNRSIAASLSCLGDGQRVGIDFPHTAAERFLFLHGHDVHRHADTDDLREHGAIKRHLMHIAKTPGIRFEPSQVVASFQVHNARVRLEPVQADLAGHVAVVGPHDPFRYSLRPAASWPPGAFAPPGSSGRSFRTVRWRESAWPACRPTRTRLSCPSRTAAPCGD